MAFSIFAINSIYVIKMMINPLKDSFFYCINKFLSDKIFIVIGVLILICKVFHTIFFGVKGETFEDWAIGYNLAHYGQYAEFINVGPTAYKLPIYPLFLAFFIKLFGEDAHFVIIVVQHIIYFFLPFLLLKIGETFNKRKVGMMAGYFFLCSPAYFFYSNVLEATNIFLLVFMLWVLLFSEIYVASKFTLSKIIGFGILSAIVALTQVVALPIMVFCILLLLFAKKMNIQQLMVFSVIMLMVYSPWVIRNQITFHQLILTKTPKWQNIYHSFTSEANVIDLLKIIPNNVNQDIQEQRRLTDEFYMENLYEDKVIKYMKGHYELTVLKGLQNAVLLWTVPVRYLQDNGVTILLGRKVYVLMLNFFTLWGLMLIYKRSFRLFLFFLIIFMGFTAPYMIGHASNIRFKLDFEWIQFFIVAVFLYYKGLYILDKAQ